MAREASALSTSSRVPEQRTGEPELAADPPLTGEPVAAGRAVSFDRLLSVSVLTPAQAMLVAVQLLDAAESMGAVEGDPPACASLGAVTLLPSGDIGVDRPDAGEGTRVSTLLERLLQNARQLRAHPTPKQLQLLRRLEDATGDPLSAPGARARELEAALAETLGSGARQRISGQLAALVEAFAHVGPGVSGSPGPRPAPRPVTPAAAAPRVASKAQGSSRTAPRRATPDEHTSSRPPRRSRHLLRRRSRGRRVALVVLVLAAVLAVSGYVVLRGPGVGFLGLGRGSQPAASGTTTPARPSRQSAHQPARHHRQAVPALAGRQAGRVTGVTVQKTGSCTPGTLCPVKVTVHLRPAPTSQQVGWKVGAARLCTRRITWSPSTTVTARPGWTTVYASSSVRVPRGRSLALVGLTTTPARAQSRPVPVAGSSLHC